MHTDSRLAGKCSRNTTCLMHEVRFYAFLTSATLVLGCGARSDIGNVYQTDAATADSTTVDGATVDGATDGGIPPDVSCGIWPMTGHDPARTARGVFNGPRTANVLWTVALDDPWPAAIAADGTVYVVDKANTLHAIASNGMESWSAPDESSPSWLNTPITPAIGCDGTIYLHGGTTILPTRYDVDEIIAARSPDGGATLWSYAHVPDEAQDSPIPFPTRIYYANENLNAFAIDGGLEWSTPTHVNSGCAVDLAETVYGAFADIDDGGEPTGVTRISAVAASGIVAWAVPLSASYLPGSFVLGGDGTLFVPVSMSMGPKSTNERIRI